MDVTTGDEVRPQIGIAVVEPITNKTNPGTSAPRSSSKLLSKPYARGALRHKGASKNLPYRTDIDDRLASECIAMLRRPPERPRRPGIAEKNAESFHSFCV